MLLFVSRRVSSFCYDEIFSEVALDVISRNWLKVIVVYFGVYLSAVLVKAYVKLPWVNWIPRIVLSYPSFKNGIACCLLLASELAGQHLIEWWTRNYDILRINLCFFIMMFKNVKHLSLNLSLQTGINYSVSSYNSH